MPTPCRIDQEEGTAPLLMAAAHLQTPYLSGCQTCCASCSEQGEQNHSFWVLSAPVISEATAAPLLAVLCLIIMFLEVLNGNAKLAL